MPATTGRLALPYPIPDDTVDVPRDVQALADKLAPNTAIFLQGTAAARPAAGVAGRLYFATDTAALNWDSGTIWVPVGGAGLAMLGFVGGILTADQSVGTGFTSLSYLNGVAVSGGTGLTTAPFAATVQVAGRVAVTGAVCIKNGATVQAVSARAGIERGGSMVVDRTRTYTLAANAHAAIPVDGAFNVLVNDIVRLQAKCTTGTVAVTSGTGSEGVTAGNVQLFG